MKRPLIIFSVIALILLGLIVLKNVQRTIVEKKEDSSTVGKLAITFDPAKVTECVIASAQESVQLKKENNVWRILNLYGGIDASNDTFQEFLNRLKNLQGEERSREASVLNDYGIADEEAISVELKSEGRTLDFLLIGTKATESRENFIRRKGSSIVYTVTSDILSYLGFGNKEAAKNQLNAGQWIDKKLLSIDVASVVGVTIKEEGKILVAASQGKDEKDKGLWKFAGKYSFAVDAEKIRNYLEMLNSMRGAELVPAKGIIFSDKDWTLTLDTKEGKPLVLKRAVKTDGAYVHVLGKEYALKLNPHFNENLNKTDGDLFVSNLLGLDENKVTEIKFSQPAMKQKDTLVKSEVKDPKDPAAAVKIVWKSAQGELADEKVKSVLTALKNISVDTRPQAKQKGNEVLVLTMKQDKLVKELRVREIISQKSSLEKPCFAATLSGDSSSYCLQEGTWRYLESTIQELYKKEEKVEAGR